MSAVKIARTSPPARAFPAPSGIPPSTFIPRRAIQRFPNTGGEYQTAPMTHATIPATITAIQLTPFRLNSTTETTSVAGHAGPSQNRLWWVGGEPWGETFGRSRGSGRGVCAFVGLG